MKNAKTYLPVPSADGTKAERSEAAAVAAGHPDPEVVARAKRRIFTGDAHPEKDRWSSGPAEERLIFLCTVQKQTSGGRLN